MNTSIRLKSAALRDAETIANLAEITWYAHYPPIIGVDQVRYMLDKMYHIDVLCGHISNGPQEFYLILDDGEPTGFIAVEMRLPDELFLQKLYVLPQMHRRGFGAGALNQIIEHYPHATSMRLQVNRQNITAINFYFKRGFTIECAADFDIGNGYFMNDFIMVKQFR